MVHNPAYADLVFAGHSSQTPEVKDVRHIRFALIENRHRTKQALRGIKKLFQEHDVSASFLPPLVVGLAGFGTVGSGIARILTQNQDIIKARTGRGIVIKTVLVRNLEKARANPALPEGVTLTTDASALLNDADIHVVLELMGGVDTAKTFIEHALNAGKHVVTANKALLAETGNHLFALAAEKGLHLAYEASVCGGIPIVQTLREGLAANHILSLVGILNGTSNYILSEMTTKGLEFDVALAKAQELGYAEADPTLDIGGYDAAHKLALLIRLAWGQEYPYAKLPVKGITDIAAEDIIHAREFGCRIKLVGHARMVDGRIEAGVFPTLVPEVFLLAKVGGAFNAVRIEGDAVGSVFLHGKGAGDMPTGSAVAADLLAVAKNLRPDNTGFVNPALPQPAVIMPEAEAESPCYIRLLVSDTPGVLRDVAGILSDNGISIAQVVQKNPRRKERAAMVEPITVPLIIMTHRAPMAGVAKAMNILASAPYVHQAPVHFRVLEKSTT